MKKIGPMMMGILAVLIGGAMFVTAVVLSNILVYTNQVQGITLSSNWSNGAKTLGTENDFTVTYASPVGTPSAAVMFNLSRTGILPTDVTLQYYTGVWVTATFTQNGPDSITCSAQTIASGSGGGYDYKLRYNVPGTYTMTIWAG